MAYTKIHAVKATVQKAVNYICNPQKTDENILVYSYGCSPKTAAYDFRFALSKTGKTDTNKAYHLIQSFLPGEAGYSKAHRIGIELADHLLEGKYSYVLTTHTDRGHIHNHIIFCAADNINNEKYHDCKKSYYHIRKLSDDLCREHGLSVITPGKSRGKSYKEWQENQSASSYKEKLKSDIDEAVKSSTSYGECIELIKAKGYEIKGESFGENALKYISFRPLDRERFIRGSSKSLGAEYTKERIRERIEKSLEHNKKRSTISSMKQPAIKDYSNKNLIDTTGEKFTQSPGLKHWADIQNLKIAAASYSTIGSISELEKQIESKKLLAKTARESLVDTEHKLKDLGEILKYAKQYKENHIYSIRYKKSKDRDRYFRQHEAELILHDGAENMLKNFGIDIKRLDVEKLQKDFNSLRSKKEALKNTYKSAEKETEILNRKMDNLHQYLGEQNKDKSPIKQSDKKTKFL